MSADDETDIVKLLKLIDAHVPTWAPDHDDDFPFDSGTPGEPEWNYLPPIDPIYKLGVLINHPVDQHLVRICRCGRTLLGNFYRLEIHNNGIGVGGPDYWYRDCFEFEI